MKRIADVTGPETADLKDLLRELSAIRADMVNGPALSQPHLDKVHANNRDSARNLLHYLALRRHDLRSLQLRLAARGLSSLGRTESHVMASINAVIAVLHALDHSHVLPPEQKPEAVDFVSGQRLLADHTNTLLGTVPAGREVRIMVTMPSEAADDYLIIHNLLQQGMDCMRINCAHDNAAAWLRMIGNLKKAELSLGRSCRVVMDLAGPKLRTGPLGNGPAVVRIRPKRNTYGKVMTLARVWLTSEAAPQPPPKPADGCLPVPGRWLVHLRTGDLVTCTDARGSKRTFETIDVTENGCWAETAKTAYIIPGTRLYRLRGPGRKSDRVCQVGSLPSGDNFITLQHGDALILTRDLKPGRPATHDSGGTVLTPATIGCTIPEVFEDVQAGEPIWFDDGKIGGIVDKVETKRVHVRITQELLKPMKLRGDKGINLPDSTLRLAALTAKDIKDLSFLARHADVIELSFANHAHDVESLQKRLKGLGQKQPAIVLKIETRRGFENLPGMLLAAMRAPSCGVMIARGDLAVECGFERLAEVQEEILWICEAAHVPVIWATQVLETLAQNGRPSRAEITDAAMGRRAECVMLNKGPYVVSAVKVLDDILRRMQEHQAKKTSMLRHLRLADVVPAQAGKQLAKDKTRSLVAKSN